MQSIGDDTMISGFIQNLIANTPLPIYDTVSIGDTIIKDIYYIYDFNLIQCTKTGRIGVTTSNNTDQDSLAEYREISRFDFGVSYPKITYKYFAANNYYDSETHYHLGRYLRCIRDIYGVNYMPFYNCNNQAYLYRVNDYYEGKYIYAVPIKFNTIYTISYFSNHYVNMQPILYDTAPIEIAGWSDIVNPVVLNGHSYLNYTYFNIDTTNADIYRHQKYLYLLFSSSYEIQSLSVIEGKYSSSDLIYIGNFGEAKTMNPPGVVSYDKGEFDVVSKLKLLSDTGRDKSYAFSNRLFEGLLHHTINKQDDVYWDIARVQKKLGMNPDGIWQDNIQVKAFRDYTSNQNKLLNPQFNQYDMNGNVDKDVEYWLFGNNISSNEEL